MRILVVEDDALLGDAIQAGLRQQGFVADWVRDGVAADLALEAGAHGAVVLDVGLPRRSGLEVLARLRGRRDKVPVLILTARDTVEDRIAGVQAVTKLEVADLLGDKTLSLKQHKQLLEALHMQMPSAGPVKYAANVPLVIKFYDKLLAAYAKN